MLALAACPADDPENGDDGTDATSGAAGSTHGDGSASTSGASVDAGDDGVTAEGGGTGEPSGPCLPDQTELTDVVFEMTTHRVLGEDVDSPFDPSMGSYACVYTVGDFTGDPDTGPSAPPGTGVVITYGPSTYGEPISNLRLVAGDGVRAYDLATDVGTPGSAGDFGIFQLSYVIQIEPAGFAQFDTLNNSATGTVDVTALPVGGETTIAFTAQGEIAGPDGWEFDISFSGTLVE